MSAAAILTIVRNGETLKSQELEGEAVLGRGEGCLIRLEDRAVSRQHALFRTTREGVHIERKNEFAPLLVNGAECTQALLKEGDVVSIGPYLVKVSVPQSSSQREVVHAQHREVKGDRTAILSVVPQPNSDSVGEPDQKGEPSLAEPSASAGSPPELAGLEFAEPGELGELPAIASDAASAPSLDGASAQAGEEIFFDATGSGGTQAFEKAEQSGLIADDAKTNVLSQDKLQAELLFQPGSANVERYLYQEGEVSLGRGRDCTIVLNDKKSSRRHATISRRGVSFVLRDLGSANGTYVNGQKVPEAILNGDDEIRIGEVRFRFRAISTDFQAKVQELPAARPTVEATSVGLSRPFMSAMPQQSDGGIIVGGGGAGGVEDFGSQAPSSPNQFAMNAPTGNTNPNFEMGSLVGLQKPASGSLLEKFRGMPPRKQMLYGLGGVAILAALLFQDADETSQPKRDTGKKAAATAQVPTVATFESLGKKEQEFVEAQHALAFQHYGNGEFDKALFEIKKIFAYLPDYKDSRDIERYAAEGKRKLQALEEEKKKKEEEARIKAQVAQTLQEIGALMEKQAYDQAKELFSTVLTLDPDNTQVATWQKIIADYEARKAEEAQIRQVLAATNARARETYVNALKVRKSGQPYEAIDLLNSALDIEPSDRSLIRKIKEAIVLCKKDVDRQRAPLLVQAREAEKSGEFSNAFRLYRKASQIDPIHPEPPQGMDRIRDVLHGKAKELYTEAVLAESYSDFEVAKSKFEEVLKVAPEDDVYFGRARRKLARYILKGDQGT